MHVWKPRRQLSPGCIFRAWRRRLEMIFDSMFDSLTPKSCNIPYCWLCAHVSRLNAIPDQSKGVQWAALFVGSECWLALCSGQPNLRETGYCKPWLGLQLIIVFSPLRLFHAQQKPHIESQISRRKQHQISSASHVVLLQTICGSLLYNMTSNKTHTICKWHEMYECPSLFYLVSMTI